VSLGCDTSDYSSSHGESSFADTLAVSSALEKSEIAAILVAMDQGYPRAL